MNSAPNSPRIFLDPRRIATLVGTPGQVLDKQVLAWNVGVSLVLDWCSPSKWGQTRRDRLENQVLPENTRVRTGYTRVLPGFFTDTRFTPEH